MCGPVIETTSLLPPSAGPLANPPLFGVAGGLSMLFPLTDADRPHEGEPDERDAAVTLTTRRARTAASPEG